MATFDEVMKASGYDTPPKAAKKEKGTSMLDTGEYIPTAQGTRRIRLESGGFLRPPRNAAKRALSIANPMRGVTDPAAEGINARKSYKDVE